ncbi:hypothetical protein ES702_03000 [subsurface metagenome]
MRNRYLYNKIAQDRYKLLAELEKQRNSKIITLVGISPASSLNIEASGKIVENLRRLESNQDIEIFIHTIGGDLDAGWRIANEILYREGSTSVIVTELAKSTGTLISLAATRVIARPQAEFGPVDPYIQVRRREREVSLPALELTESEDELEKISAQTALTRSRERLMTILQERLEKTEEERNEVAKILLREDVNPAERSHFFPINPHYLLDLGFDIQIDALTKFCELYSLYLNDPKRESLERGSHLVEMLPV